MHIWHFPKAFEKLAQPISPFCQHHFSTTKYSCKRSIKLISNVFVSKSKAMNLFYIGFVHLLNHSLTAICHHTASHQGLKIEHSLCFPKAHSGKDIGNLIPLENDRKGCNNKGMRAQQLEKAQHYKTQTNTERELLKASGRTRHMTWVSVRSGSKPGGTLGESSSRHRS